MLNRWFQAICILVALSSNTLARPKEDVFPVYRSLQAGKDGSHMVIATDRKTDKTVKSLEDIANVARSSYVPPALVPVVTPAPAKSADHTAEKDIRTPPKLKEIVKDVKNVSVTTAPSTTRATVEPAVDKVEANGKFQLSGAPVPPSGTFEGKAASSKKDDVVKGVAVPVIMEDEVETPPKKLQKLPNVAKPKEEKKKVVSTVRPVKETPTTTPSSGLSTWILLTDNREATTPSSVLKKKATTTTKKPAKLQQSTTVVKLTTSKPAKKVSPAEKKNEPESALETMVKQKTAGVLVTAQKKKDAAEKKVATVPPAIVIETSTASSFPDWEVTESTQETTTKKKKTSSKKRKKNKNRTKKPAEKSGADQIINDLVKQPKQPVGAQFYNFLSREIMPTVGLGLVGVLVTAGLAGLLGYNPFYGANIPVRRTYESQHGYYPNGNYYSYQSDYADSAGKNEEVLFREVLSGMPEDSRYGMPPAEVSYPETTLHKSQEQAYNLANKNKEKKSDYPTKYSDPYDAPVKSDPSSEYSDQYTHYDSYTNQDQVGAKYPVYSGSEPYVYPEENTEKYKASAKYSEEGMIEKQPEALYRVSSDYAAGSDSSSGSEADASPSASATDSDQSWHRIGAPMDYSQTSLVEPGPRRLDLDKMTDKLTQPETHKRNKRSPEGILARLVRRSNEVVNINLEDEKQNEIDFEEGAGSEENVTEKAAASTETQTESEPSSTTPLPSTEQPSLIDSFPNENSPPASTETPASLIDVLKRLAQFKLRLGLNFLKATNEAFGKYLEGVSQRVEDSMASDTNYPAIRYAWLGRESSDGAMKIREKRYQREVRGEEDQVMES